MNADEKTLAESVLQHLLPGMRVCGVNFYAVPVLVIDSGSQARKNGPIYLTIESEWRILDAVPSTLPILNFPTTRVERSRTSELIAALAYLGWNRIRDVHLDQIIPHLLINFENGQTLFINGHHDEFESWEVSADDFMVVATPSDGIAVWCPDEFATKTKQTPCGG